MPRNVRNFWLTLEVDGKKARVATGPVAKDGGFDLVIRMRHKGEVEQAMRLCGAVERGGRIVLRAYGAEDGNMTLWHSLETER